ncbi:MAG: hypothetical protein ACR2QJ_16565 [Geminicoccaceae bacterium]
MTTSSTLKVLKEQDGPISPREQPATARSSALIDRLQTWERSVWRHRWLSIATAWVICLAGWAVITLWPTNYNASAVIFANLAELADQAPAAAGPDQSPVATLKSMLLSDDGLEEIQRKVPLDPEKVASLTDDLFLKSTMPPLFVVAYDHADPDVARQVLETVIGGFHTRLNDAAEANLEAAETLDREIGETSRRLQTSEAGLVVFKRTNAEYLEGATRRTGELALMEREVESLETKVNETAVERDEIALILAKAQAPNDGGTGPERTLEVIESERSALDDELANLQKRYADTHPYVIAVADAIKALELEAETLAPPAGDGEEAPLDREQLEQRHGELIIEVATLNSHLLEKRQEIEVLQALTKTTTSVEAELGELEATKEELEVALAALQLRRDELGAVKGGEATQKAFRLIKQPERPTNPVGPSRLMALAGVLLGGAGLGAIAAMICNRYKGVFESAWQLRRRFDVGVLGTISEVMTPAERQQLGYSRMAFGAACLALVGMFGGLAIAELTDTLAPLGEQLRKQLLG